MTKTETWTVRLRRSLVGLVVVSVRPEKGRTIHSDLPSHVMLALAAEKQANRGAWFVTDPVAIAILTGPTERPGAGLDLPRILSVRCGEPGEWVVKIEIHKLTTVKREPTPPTLDWDAAHYEGDGEDGVYYAAVRCGRWWWALATVDSNTGGFTQSLAAERYTTRPEAFRAARGAALEWCHNNEVPLKESELSRD